MTNKIMFFGLPLVSSEPHINLVMGSSEKTDPLTNEFMFHDDPINTRYGKCLSIKKMIRYRTSAGYDEKYLLSEESPRTLSRATTVGNYAKIELETILEKYRDKGELFKSTITMIKDHPEVYFTSYSMKSGENGTQVNYHRDNAYIVWFLNKLREFTTSISDSFNVDEIYQLFYLWMVLSIGEMDR